MTLILSLATADYVLQVSDRQLTYKGGRVADSNRNKVVIWPPSFIFSFTGLGEIAGEPTDVWLFKTLTNIKETHKEILANELFDKLALNASQVFREIRTVDRRHCFVAIGWVTLGHEEHRYRPVIVTVSNALDDRGSWLVPKSVKDKFSVRTRLLRRSASHLLEISGQDISVQAKRLIRRRMRRPTKASAAAELLWSILQIEAARNCYVGSKSLIVNIPKGILDSSRYPFLHDMPSEGSASVLYVGVQGEQDQYGPPFVDRLAGYHVRPLPDNYVLSGPEPWSAIILTERRLTKGYYGRDSWSMAVCDDYDGRYRSSSDITGARMFPEGYSHPHPYYGLLVGLRVKKLEDTVIDEIKYDKRHLVVLSIGDDPVSAPNIEWMTQLRDWLVAHGMPAMEATAFCESICGLSREEIVERLNELLRIPVPGRSSTNPCLKDS